MGNSIVEAFVSYIQSTAFQAVSIAMEQKTLVPEDGAPDQ